MGIQSFCQSCPRRTSWYLPGVRDGSGVAPALAAPEQADGGEGRAEQAGSQQERPAREREPGWPGRTIGDDARLRPWHQLAFEVLAELREGRVVRAVAEDGTEQQVGDE